MKTTINSSLLAKLKPKSKPYEVRDDKITGFMVRVNISGKLVYMCEYARGKRILLGKVGVITTAQARDKALVILGDAARGIDPASASKKKSALALKNFIENEYAPWIKQHRKSSEKTLAHINRCFTKPFGDKPLLDFTPAFVDQWRTQRLKDGLSTETVNRDIATFKAALSKAVLWSLIEKHPLEKLKLLKRDRSSKVRFLSADEEKRLRQEMITREHKIKIDRCSANEWRKERNYKLLPNLNQFEFADHIRPMVLLSINTGLRRGEIFSLEWENINFERALLTIEGAYAKSGKTRHIPLNSEALNILKAWKLQVSTNLVFSNKDGERFDTIKKGWKTILDAANIKNFRWHDLRHHFASRLVMSDVDLNTVRELLGHSDMTMTLRYAHLAPEHKANAVEKLVTNQHSKIMT
ncbi:MAG: site-specific integrase [Gammaproteobacteria bacterium]